MTSRLASQTISFVPRLCRSLQNKAALRPVPPPQGISHPHAEIGPSTEWLWRFGHTGSIATPVDFLKAIGRSADTKVTVEKWEDLWKLNGPQLKKAGLPVRDRRYILWSMEKFRQGEPLAQFAHPPSPKKKIRGHGPAVQNGKRIRSRRRR